MLAMGVRKGTQEPSKNLARAVYLARQLSSQGVPKQAEPGLLQISDAHPGMLVFSECPGEQGPGCFSLT